MRRVPSCLLFASFALALGALSPDAALAEPGFKLGAAGHHRAWSGPKSFHRGHWGGSHHSFRHRSYARHLPAFHGYRSGFHQHGFYGFGRYGHHRSVYGHSGFPHYAYGRFYPGRYGYGHYGAGRYSYGSYGHGRHFYGRHGYGYYGSGRHFYGRPGYGYYGAGHHGYGRHGYGFFPHSSWLWPSSAPYADRTVIVTEGDTPPDPSFADIPSVADLPVLAGIRSAPAAAPAVYVLGSGRRSLRSGGAKVVAMDQGGSESGVSGTGPRIIRLDAPRGR